MQTRVRDHVRVKPHPQFDFVEATFDFVAKNGNNLEATFDLVERIVRQCCFDIVAIVWTGLKQRSNTVGLCTEMYCM